MTEVIAVPVSTMAGEAPTQLVPVHTLTPLMPARMPGDTGIETEIQTHQSEVTRWSLFQPGCPHAGRSKERRRTKPDELDREVLIGKVGRRREQRSVQHFSSVESGIGTSEREDSRPAHRGTDPEAVRIVVGGEERSQCGFGARRPARCVRVSRERSEITIGDTGRNTHDSIRRGLLESLSELSDGTDGDGAREGAEAEGIPQHRPFHPRIVLVLHREATA